MDDGTGVAEAPSFAIFRGEGIATEVMTSAPLSPVALAGAQQVMAAGIAEGHQLKVLFAAAGMSLTYAWFKSGYPLPRHAHDVDCLYYILAGALKLGSETLSAGDGFFVGGGVPYAYTPGPAGVEVLEFRAAEAFDIRVLANNPAFWTRALRSVTEERAGWATQPRPSGAPAQD